MRIGDNLAECMRERIARKSEFVNRLYEIKQQIKEGPASVVDAR